MQLFSVFLRVHCAFSRFFDVGDLQQFQILDCMLWQNGNWGVGTKKLNNIVTSVFNKNKAFTHFTHVYLVPTMI